MLKKISFDTFLSIALVAMIIVLGFGVELESFGMTLSSSLLAALAGLVLMLRYLNNGIG